MAGRREAFVGWQGAFRPFRNGRKKVCLGSLASPKRRGAFVGWQGAFRPFRNGRKRGALAVQLA